MASKGNIKVNTQNIFPIIKKWLYSDKDIFVRELTVNASDAITKLDKLKNLGMASVDEKYEINIECDSDAKTIKISDNGIGMTEEEVKKYINQIAFSGAEEFIEKYQESSDTNKVIGHFGLGFYSAFMVADTVEIETKSYTGAPAVHWKCDGGTEYSIKASNKEKTGTTITLHISEDGEEFLNEARIKSVLIKYCGFLHYPIYVNGAEEAVNDTAPLWTKAPSECTDEEYIELYHRLFSDMNDPLFWIHLNVEFPFNLNGILYFPKLTHEFESAKGKIKLFNNRVFVADNIEEVIPEFLMLLKGVIDCPDIPLNVSRSALQNDGTVVKISSHITKKVADRLVSLQKENRENFNEYWPHIAPFIEYGCLSNEKFYDKLKPVMQAKTTDGEYVGLVEYALKNDKCITYVTDENLQAQYIRMLKKDGKTALIMPHLIDAHFISHLEMHEQWKFVRVDSLPENTSDNDELVKLFKENIGEEIKITTSSLSLKIPAIIVQEENQRRMSDIAKMFGNNMPIKQEYTLVLNSDSEIIKKLPDLDEEKIGMLCKQIYDVARLSSGGLTSDEMTAFLDRSAEIMEKMI